MLKAKKKNRVLRIPDEKKAEYEALGYTITTMEGDVVFEPEDAAKKVADLEKEIEHLKVENEALKAEIENLRSKKRSAAVKKPAE